MAPILFEETNVFKFAHSRMKKLVVCCTSKVDHTDFTSWNDLEQLLRRLEQTFFELIAHEQIENELVMRKLKRKLKENSLLKKNELVCNCHKDDRFTPLMNLFRDGYSFVRRGNADRIIYQVKLHKAISQFYQEFLPHMIEEENDIQPLLFKYFTDIELKMMRIEVIQHTLKRRDNSSSNLVQSIERPIKIEVRSDSSTLNRFSDEVLQSIFKHLSNDQIKHSCLLVNRQWNYSANQILRDRSNLTKLSDEILLLIFKFYLNPLDLLRSCLTVNRRWYRLIREKTLWKTVNPINWSRGQWNTNLPIEEKFIDDEHQRETKIKEIQCLDVFQRSFIENFGCFIETLVLYGSLTINDKQARSIFSFCPNLKNINIGRTSLTSKCFLQYRWSKTLESLNLDNCSLIDDQLFVNLLSSTRSTSNSIEDDQMSICQKILGEGEQIEDRCFRCLSKCSEISTDQYRLKHLTLWNCHKISDQAFRSMIDSGLTMNLISIDLSGCCKIQIETLEYLFDNSTYLEMESSYLCNQQIFSSTRFSQSNSCRNIDCPSEERFCSC